MKKIDLGQTISIIANLGVIAGIAFLALEVRQNQETLERGNAMNLIAVQNSSQEQFSHFRTLLLENDELFSIWQRGLADADLTDMEQAKFSELCSEQIYRMATTYSTWDALDKPLEAQNTVTVVRSLMARSRNYAACWERIRPVAERTGYLEFVEGIDED